jgi:hypothetical protein
VRGRKNTIGRVNKNNQWREAEEQRQGEGENGESKENK